MISLEEEDLLLRQGRTLSNILSPNPEAHTSRQLLNEFSSDDGSDEDNTSDGADEEMQGDEKIIEGEGDDEKEDTTNHGATEEHREQDEAKTDQIPSVPQSSFKLGISSPVGRGRGRASRLLSRLRSVPTPGLPIHEQNSSPSLNGNIIAHAEPEPGRILIHSNSLPNNAFHYRRPFAYNTHLNFDFEAPSTKIIFDHKSRYYEARKILQQFGIYHEEIRSYADMWSFCLKSRSIRFYKLVDYEAQFRKNPQSLPPMLLLAISQIFHEERQFWMLFERRPIFADKYFNCDIESVKEASKLTGRNASFKEFKIYPSVQVDFSYGALTSMTTYYYHPTFHYRNREDIWRVHFPWKALKFIRSTKNTRNDGKVHETQLTSTLRADLIDRAVVFNVNSSGFYLYISIKGNLHEYKREFSTDAPSRQNERISLNNDECPIFSTMCFNVSLKKYESAEKKHQAILQIKHLFKYLIDFFYFNQIQVCFGRIECRRGPPVFRPSLPEAYKNPIQFYAVTMLRNVGYSVEQKLREKKDFYQSLIDLCQSDINKLYRLCLYLVRRASEYRFLDLDWELKRAEEEYQKQSKQCQLLGEEMPTILSPPRENFTYVPSIRITPTTKQIQPLKLVKAHRVLREKKFDDPMSYALLEIRDEANRALYARDFCSLREKFHRILNDGVMIDRIAYQYLHHSMSQVKEKQFWFLNKKYSTSDVLSWMGNFDNERVVAKHAARIAQCFTSTEPSIRIPAEHVKYIPDIETPDKKYCFTDGVGTISEKYCKMVKEALNRRTVPSVLQIRYGGCKGTVSVDPKLDDQEYQLIIRHSMLKFTSDHDQLEICKVSSPRSLYLNRQDILLLSNRGVPESHFLVLQNENHLWLVQALLCSSVAFELLNERVGSMNFNFRDIANTINLVEEPFFLQLLITCGHDCVSKFQRRAKIKVDKAKARNMFGTVDEYGVLEYGQVFVQYSHIVDEKLEATDKSPTNPPTILNDVPVVITKNPCHHPGDLRTFIAVDRPELRHLVDVVVFPQKGPRPHPNEISGSDLDGDEYAVIWDSDLVPTTENYEPYDYDSQEKPKKLDHPIERSDINNVVLDIASQNLTGDMSNLHLAMADALGVCDPQVVQIAGYISQELDAPKTGKHPITAEELNRYRQELVRIGFPDFMMKETVPSYPSRKIIGQLFRSARRAILRWHQATTTHCSLRHLQTAQAEDQSLDEIRINSSTGYSSGNASDHRILRYQDQPSLSLDRTITHPKATDYSQWAQELFEVYRENLLNIISVFNYQDEIDLFCRCETLDQLGSGKQDLNISAGLELQRLIDVTVHQFFHQFDRVQADPTVLAPHDGTCSRARSCPNCKELKLAQAAACYSVCYNEAAKQSSKARSRILSFPWLFGSLLTELKRRNQSSDPTASPSKYIVIGRAMRNAAKRLLDERAVKLKILWAAYTEKAHLFLRSVPSITSQRQSVLRRPITEPDQQTPELSLTLILFIEIMNHWIEQQKIFGAYSPIDKKPLIRELCWHQLMQEFIFNPEDDLTAHQQPSLTTERFEQYKVVFQQYNNEVMMERYENFIQEQIFQAYPTFDCAMYQYSSRMIRLCFQLARRQQSNEYATLSDYLVLALQSIGIEKDMKDIIFDTSG